MENNMSGTNYPRGSEWCKWDLHFHTPSSYDYDDPTVTNEGIVNVLKQEKITLVVITDHHVIDINRISNLRKIAQDEIIFFPGIEFCSDARGEEPIHFIGIFPEHCDINYIWNEINVSAKIAKKKREGKKDEEVYCDLENTSKLIKALGGIVSIHAGSKSNSIEKIANSLPTNMAEKEDIAKWIDIFEIGQEKDQKDYINIVFPKIGKYYPMIICSDNHNAKSYKLKQTCWIKADPTFEGLKQILYEPVPGDRVWIGPIKPDSKNQYQIIKKIKFSNTTDFPTEIEFNNNLCSIIGSRSSGKSALLAYIAHAIDKKESERLVKGPGEGEEYKWGKIAIGHSVEWANGLGNDESPGQIVYIPQNHLFDESKNPDELKKSIKPILFRIFPDFEIKYYQTENFIETCNKQITEQIEEWFKLSDILSTIDGELKQLGNENVVEKEKLDIESQIEIFKQKHELTEEDVKKYQQVKATIDNYQNSINQIVRELSMVINITEENDYFTDLGWMLIPDIDNLPSTLQTIIRDRLSESKNSVLNDLNRKCFEYKQNLEQAKGIIEFEVSRIESENNDLIEKYNKNIELESLVTKLTEYKNIIKNIEEAESRKKENKELLEKCEKQIASEIKTRAAHLEQLKKYLDEVDQTKFKDIKFSIEYAFKYDDVVKVTQKVNVREKTDFVEDYKLMIDLMREQPAKFLSSVYSGNQKINVGNDKKEVIKEILTLTEIILFTAEMEGDKIGGLTETTMTPGRRALFLLKLILAESEDTWPLLIDQPEDNLDSRSISNEIVPFLREKKKERQIIMVSHNANLVIGADSEQIIVANRNGTDRPNEDSKQFNYLTGSIENTKEKDKDSKDTLKAQGIREHACDILDGGKDAFEKREKKYGFV
jgi:hypothetical protein